MISALLFRTGVDFVWFAVDLQSSASPLRHEASLGKGVYIQYIKHLKMFIPNIVLFAF